MSLEAEFASATHIVFARSAKASLHQRISEIGVDPKILCLCDNLSMGPLDAVQHRLDWFTDTFGENDWREDIEQRAKFWKEVESVAGRCYIWFSRRSTLDYCGYLEWVSNSDRKTHGVIEADVPTGLIAGHQWLGYFAQVKPADRDQQSMEAQDWTRLVSENAPVRVIEHGKVVSAAMDCFDSLLLAKASPDWKSAALMVGEVLGNDFEEVHQTGDLLLVNRLWALVDAGLLEFRGDESSIRSTQMRLKPS